MINCICKDSNRVTRTKFYLTSELFRYVSLLCPEYIDIIFILCRREFKIFILSWFDLGWISDLKNLELLNFLILWIIQVSKLWQYSKQYKWIMNSKKLGFYEISYIKKVKVLGRKSPMTSPIELLIATLAMTRAKQLNSHVVNLLNSSSPIFPPSHTTNTKS